MCRKVRQIQGHPYIHGKFVASLGFLVACRGSQGKERENIRFPENPSRKELSLCSPPTVGLGGWRGISAIVRRAESISRKV